MKFTNKFDEKTSFNTCSNPERHHHQRYSLFNLKETQVYSDHKKALRVKSWMAMIKNEKCHPNRIEIITQVRIFVYNWNSNQTSSGEMFYLFQARYLP